MVRGGVEPVTPNQADMVLGATFSKIARMGHFVYPVCLFYFTMREDQAFFAWLAEPIMDGGGSPKLLQHNKAGCKILTDKLLNEAVERIVHWYDASQMALVAQIGAIKS